MPITSVRAASTISGHVFERLTECLLGGARRVTNGQSDVCPDTINDHHKLLVESKASQRQHALKVDIEQMNRYRQVMCDWRMEERGYQTVYALWTYTAKRISVPKKIKYLGQKRHTKVFKTYGDVVSAIINSVTTVEVFDLRIMLRLRELAESWACPKTVSIKNYSSWKNSTGDPFWVLNVGHVFLRRFMADTERMLRAMRLDPEEFIWKESTRSGDEIVVDGKIFKAPDVHVFECLSTMSWDYRDRWEEDLGGDPFLTYLNLLRP